MLELYVVLSLGALGYLLNSTSSKVKPKKHQVNRFELPSMSNIYESTASRKADDAERRIAERAYKEALAPKKTNRIMTMAGEMVDQGEFTHNNMEPYFGGRIRQNMDSDRNRVLLETFTGVDDTRKPKCEVKSFYDQSKDLGNVYGAQNKNDVLRERYQESRIRNNELPWEKVQVGPGMGKGYGKEGSGGYQQFEVGEIARGAEKCVDQLRAKNKPKQTFGGRTVDGMKAKLRGLDGKMAKNRVERFYEQSEDQWFKTTGANLKASKVPKFNVKATHRLTTSKEIIGGAKGPDGRTLDAKVKASARQNFGNDGVRNAVLSAFGLGQKDDYGKGNVVVYQNERDLTTTRTYQGNITSLIKAIVAPIQDMIKVTKKDEGVNQPRPYGSLNAQMPSKPTIGHVDGMRGTVKETTIDAADPANLKGAQKTQIYHDDIARSTIRETIEEFSLPEGNLKPAGPVKQTIYDPTDVARTTIAETNLFDTMGMGTIKGGPVEIFEYDPDDFIPRKTTKETTSDLLDTHINLATTHKKQTLAYEDEFRTTTKQTTIDQIYDGHIEALEGFGTYDDNVDVRPTQKQFISDNDHIGSAARDLGQGHLTNDHIAPPTSKQFISDNDYYGVSESSTFKKEMSTADYENARITERKESVLFGREPTSQGPKEANNCLNVRIKKPDCDDKAPREKNNMNRIFSETPEMSDRQLTRQKKAVEIDPRIGLDRIDPDLLKAFRENIYTQSLHSVV